MHETNAVWGEFFDVSSWVGMIKADICQDSEQNEPIAIGSIEFSRQNIQMAKPLLKRRDKIHVIWHGVDGHATKKISEDEYFCIDIRLPYQLSKYDDYQSYLVSVNSISYFNYYECTVTSKSHSKPHVWLYGLRR